MAYDPDFELKQAMEQSMIEQKSSFYMYRNFFSRKLEPLQQFEINFDDFYDTLQLLNFSELNEFSIEFEKEKEKFKKESEKIILYFSKIYYAELRLEKLDYKTETNLIDLIKIYLERNKLFFLKSSPPKLCPDNLPFGFTRIPTTGDGNCLFNAISYQYNINKLLEDRKTPYQVRQDIATNPRMKKEGEWGTEDEIINASLKYKRTFIWFTNLEGEVRFNYSKFDSRYIPIILFNCNLNRENNQGNHWESLELDDYHIDILNNFLRYKKNRSTNLSNNEFILNYPPPFILEGWYIYDITKIKEVDLFKIIPKNKTLILNNLDFKGCEKIHEYFVVTDNSSFKFLFHNNYLKEFKPSHIEQIKSKLILYEDFTGYLNECFIKYLGYQFKKTKKSKTKTKKSNSKTKKSKTKSKTKKSNSKKSKKSKI